MVKNLTISCGKGIKIDKKKIHELVSELKPILEFKVSSLAINFVSPEEILEINSQYLKHFFTTDIITFNYSGENFNFDGEIFISYEDAYKNSKKFKVSFDNELLRLVIHGILHLSGFDDMKKKDKRLMKTLENALVKKFGKQFRKLIKK